MAWWVGTQEAIIAAEAAASAAVVGEPEYRGGVEVAADQRVTARWAVPAITADGQWAIPACPDVIPVGVAVVEEVAFPAEPA